MTDATPQPVFLADYRPFSHLVDQVELTFACRRAPPAFMPGCTCAPTRPRAATMSCGWTARGCGFCRCGWTARWSMPRRTPPG